MRVYFLLLIIKNRVMLKKEKYCIHFFVCMEGSEKFAHPAMASSLFLDLCSLKVG